MTSYLEFDFVVYYGRQMCIQFFFCIILMNKTIYLLQIHIHVTKRQWLYWWNFTEWCAFTSILYLHLCHVQNIFLFTTRTKLRLSSDRVQLEISADPYAWTAIHSSLWWSIKSKINVLSDGPLTSLTKPRSLYDWNISQN